MTRATHAELIDGFKAPVVRPFMAVLLDYPDGAVRLTSLPTGTVLGIDDQDWHGAGVLGQMSGLEEGAENRSYGFTLTLSGIPGNWLAYLRTQDVQGRRVDVHLGLVDEKNRVIRSQLIKRGRMDTQDAAAGQTTSVTVTCEDVLVDWERARVRRCTDVDHRTRYPNDGFFKYVAALENQTLAWGR
jgi:hypothetical protein